MLGMKVGEKKSIRVKAADAYGEYDKAAVREAPRAQFPKDLTFEVTVVKIRDATKEELAKAAPGQAAPAQATPK